MVLFQVKDYVCNRPGRPKMPLKYRELNAVKGWAEKGIKEGPGGWIWTKLLPIPEDSILSQTKDLSQTEKDKLLDIYSEARTVWKCYQCNTFEQWRIISGYIYCKGKIILYTISIHTRPFTLFVSDCNYWYHKSCVQGQVEKTWNCGKCNQELSDTEEQG